MFLVFVSVCRCGWRGGSLFVTSLALSSLARNGCIQIQPHTTNTSTGIDIYSDLKQETNMSEKESKQ